MANYSEQRVLPYNRRKLFNIVADVERYPEFLPGWNDVRVVSREENHAVVHQTLGIGPVQTRFCSSAEFRPPEGISIHSDEGPFRKLDIAWLFESRGEHSSEVTLTVTVQLKQVVFRELFERWFSASTSSILAAFERRAGQLQAQGGELPDPADPERSGS